MSQEGAIIAVDLGGTRIKAAVVDASGSIVAELARPTGAERGPEAVVGEINGIVAELRAQAPQVRAIGIVVPGVVNAETGVAEFSANVGFRDVPLRELISQANRLPALLDHDVQAAGVAERTIGLTVGVDDAFVAVIGTGIAAVVHAAGHNVRGASHVAGEFGHIPVWPDGEACPCGQHGCLERYASAAAIARRYKQLSGGGDLSARDVAALCSTDPLAAQVWSEAAQALAIALATTTMILDPAIIVLGGGLSEAGAQLLEPVQTELAQRVRWREPPPLVLSELGGRAGLLGAAVLTWRSLGLDRFGSWRQAH